MPLLYKAESLQMNFCLECHRNPEKYVRPKDEVYNLDWEWGPEVDPLEAGRKLVAEYDIRPKDTCSTCHR
jgi:hypothetical protein